MAESSVIPQNQQLPGMLTIVPQRHVGLEDVRRPLFSRPYTTFRDDTEIIIGDMVSDAQRRHMAGFSSRLRAGQLPQHGPLAIQTPLAAPERATGSILDTSS